MQEAKPIEELEDEEDDLEEFESLVQEACKKGVHVRWTLDECETLFSYHGKMSLYGYELEEAVKSRQRELGLNADWYAQREFIAAYVLRHAVYTGGLVSWSESQLQRFQVAALEAERLAEQLEAKGNERLRTLEDKGQTW